MLTPEQAVLVSLLTCIAGAVLTLLVSRSKLVAGWLAFAITTGTAILILSAVFKVLLSGPSAHPATFWAMPQFAFALRIYVDGLTAVFLLLAALIAVPASFYSILYMRIYRDYSVARYYPYFLLFLAAMYGLLSTTDMMWFFFIFWQLMTLPGYALIRFEHRKRQNVWAANKFLIMMQIACVATMIGAELLAIGGKAVSGSANLKYDFDTVSANLPLLLATRPGITALAFGLFLIGFGIKMGMWPFGQVWLPDAHPAAPSPVSAMLSGVMIKTGVYGLMRYFLWLVPVSAQADYPLARWGMLVAVLGTITLFTGTMQALKQEQSKRLLAFHSIGQIGYILLGTGTCMALLPVNTPATAGARGHRFLWRAVPRAEPRAVQGTAVSECRIHAARHRHAGPQPDGRHDEVHAADRHHCADRLVLHLGRAAVQRLRQQVEHLRGGDSGQRVGALSRRLRGDRDLDQRAHAGIVHQVFRRELSVAHERAGARAGGQSGRLEVGWMMQLPQLALAFLCVLLGVVPAIGFRLMQRALEASRGGLGTALANAFPMRSGPLAGVTEVDSAAVFAPARSRGRVGADVPAGVWHFETRRARRAGPPLRGSAVMRAKRSATATSRTISTAKSNATSAGWAACRARPNRPR